MRKREIGLINELRRNSRRALTEISWNAGIPLSSAFKMLKRLEAGTIKKNVCLVDFAKLGFPFKMGMFIRANDKGEIASFLSKHPSVNSLLRLSGDFDFFVELIFKDMAGCQDFVEEISEISKKTSVHFLTDVKQVGFQI